MQESKLFSLLETFDKRDWKEFRGYLLSRMREKSEILFVYDYIRGFSHDLKGDGLTVEIAIKRLFQSKTRKSFLNLLSKLHAFCLDYFAVSEMMKDGRERSLYLIMSLNRRGLYSKSRAMLDVYIDEIDTGVTDLWDSYYRLRGYHEMKFSDNPAKTHDVKELYHGIVASYLLLKDQLKAYYVLDGHHTPLVGSKDVSSDLKKLLVVESSVSHDEVLTFLNNLIRLIADEDLSAEGRIFNFLVKYQNDLAPNLGSLGLLHLIQYHLRRVKGGREVPSQLYELHQMGFANGWLLDHGSISSFRYGLAIDIGCLSVSKEEILASALEWSTKLSISIREIHYQIGLATIHFYFGDHHKSQLILRDIPHSSVRAVTLMRCIQLINEFVIYQDDIDFLLSQINSFVRYNSRHRLAHSELHYEGLTNFTKLMRLIVMQSDQHSIDEIMAPEVPLVRKAWFRRYFRERAN